MRARVAVAAALVFRAGRVLICQRKKGTFMAGYWEFPGGKCEKGETYRQAVQRELKEEFDIKASGLKTYKAMWVHYEGKPPCRLQFFKGSLRQGKARSMENQKFKWEKPSRLGRYKFLPADLGLVKKLNRLPKSPK